MKSRRKLLCLLLAVFILYEQLEQRILAKHRGTQWIPKAAGIIAAWIFPVPVRQSFT